MSDARTEALMLAATLPLNETIYADCPSCGGWRKLSVTRVREGVLWNCFKDSCSTAGRDIVQGELLPPKRKQARLRAYAEALIPLELSDCGYFYDRFHLDVDNNVVRKTEDGRYALSVFDPRGYCRGYVVRSEWKGIPKFPLENNWAGPKTVLYMHARGPTLSWYRDNSTSKVVLVEDQLSAMRAQQEGLSAVALLGTSLDNDKVREIAMCRPSEVIIALDADATDTAFKLARTWGMAFPKTRVAVLERDLKDEGDGDIHHVLGL